MLDYSAFTPQSSKYNRSNEILRKNGIEPILRKGETDSDLSNTNDGKEANVNKTFSETSSHNNDEVNSYLQKIEKKLTINNVLGVVIVYGFGFYTELKNILTRP